MQEFKELWVNESREYLLNNQKPLPYLQSGFHQFSRERDERFLDSLQLNWVKFPIVPGSQVPKSRKLDPSPQFIFEEASYHNPQFLPCFWEEEKMSENMQDVPLPRIRKPEYSTSSPLKLSFRFFGNNVSVSYDRLLSLPVRQEITNESIADYWKKFTIANSNHLIGQLMAVKDRLGLNDWGFYILVKSCSAALYPKDEFGEVLLAWALMIRSGFDVRIGYNQLGASILYSTNSKIYNVPTLKIGGSYYYIDNPIAYFPIVSYNANHEAALNPICLNINRSLNFQGENEIKKIQFNWDKKTFEFNLKYNPEVIRYLEEYPSTVPELCYDAPFTALTLESLTRQVKPVLASIKKEEAVAFLQQFVQKSFTYFPYNDLYGRDRFMFPEELLFKDEGNDKGKSLLFAWMITHLLNQKAALVEFPGFYSVAVSLDQPLDGDNFMVNGKSFTIADPTFNNAPLGLVMKEFYPQKPLIRVLKNRAAKLADQDKIWKLANSFGAKRSGSPSDFLEDGSGNSYITGFLNEITINQQLPSPTPFIAKFDRNRSLVWMVKFRSNGKAFGLELKQLNDDEFYLAGSFRGKLESNGIMIQTAPADPDLFFVQFNNLGEVNWLTKAGLDQLEEDTPLFYVSRFTRSGEIQSVNLANEDERSGQTGFRRDTREGLCFIASRFQTLGLEKSGDEPFPKSSPLLKQNISRMRQLGIEPTVAIVASLLKSLIYSGNQLTGKELSMVSSEKTDTHFTLNNFFQKIKFFKNNDGIVDVNTVNSSDIQLTGIRIANHAKFAILPFDNNDLKLNILNGFYYEADRLHERINNLILELTTGNIIMDLGNEHTIISRNLSHQIVLQSNNYSSK